MKDYSLAVTLDTPESCEAGLDLIDAELARRGDVIRIASVDKWSPKRMLSRLTGLLWARQIKQDGRNVCDSPYIQILERRATTDLAGQEIDYCRIVNQITRVIDASESKLQSLSSRQKAESEKASAPIDVDLDYSGSLDEETREAVRAHDEWVRREELKAVAAATSEKRRKWEAVRTHAQKTLETALSDKGEFETMVRSHYAEQAQEHVKWAVKRNRLVSPFLLPGALSGGLPELHVEKGV